MKTLAFALINLCAISAYAADKADAPPTAAAPAAAHAKLPLDHGPRAQSTPWLNEQTRQRLARQPQQQQQQQPEQAAAHAAAQPAAIVK